MLGRSAEYRPPRRACGYRGDAGVRGGRKGAAHAQAFVETASVGVEELAASSAQAAAPLLWCLRLFDPSVDARPSTTVRCN